MQIKGHRLTLRLVVLIAAIATIQLSPHKADASGNPFGVGATADAQTFTTHFSSSNGFDGEVLLDTELWDSKRNRVFQYFETRDLKGQKTASITKPITAGLPDGVYTVKGGIFSPNWTKSYLWTEFAGSINVQNGISNPAFQARSVLEENSFKTVFKSSHKMNGQYLFDVELWDTNNKRVFQYFNTLSVSSDTMTIAQDIPAHIQPGTYTARVGVFLPGWSTKLLWEENAGTIVIGEQPSPVVYSSVAKNNLDNTFQTDFTASKKLTGTYLFDVELWDSSNKRVYQSFDDYALSDTNTMSVTRSIPTNLPAGKYTVKSGWFTPNWNTKLLWSENSGSIEVRSETSNKPVPSTAPTTVAPTTTIAAPTTTNPPTTTIPAAALPAPEPAPQMLEFNAKSEATGSNFVTNFNSSLPMSGEYLFDVELWDSNNKKVFQYFETQKHSNSSKTSVSQLIPANLPVGIYTVKAGVFSPDWNTKYLWSETVGTVKVTSAAQPIFNENSPAGVNGKWNLIFGDEFNGKSLDKTKWTTCSQQMIWWKDTCMGHGYEQQAYTDDNVNIVDFGNGERGLRLTAKRAGQWSFTHDNVPAGAERWDSGMVSTSPNTMGFNQPGYKPFDFKYGFYEVRMKAPRGKGLWPAAWAFPTDNIPPQELDLIEILGHDTKTAYQTVHYPGGNSSVGNTSIDTADGFHVYGMDWTPERITWYIDGKVARTQFTNAGQIPDKDMYLMLNFAVGGAWPGVPDSSTPSVAHTDIDWVRVWKRG